jgi:hypothetical protein
MNSVTLDGHGMSVDGVWTLTFTSLQNRFFLHGTCTSSADIARTPFTDSRQRLWQPGRLTDLRKDEYHKAQHFRI